MTLEELKTRCERAGFQYAYGLFKNPVEPPHIIAICNNTNNFMADNEVYIKDIQIQLYYTYIDKNIELQDKIENEVLSGIAWNKSEETYFSDENIWQVCYFFEI